MARTTIVVSGALANKPGNGGEAWVRMSWATGLRRLGFDVWFIEQIDRDFLAAGHPETYDSAPASFFKEVVQQFDLADRSALIDDRGHSLVGPHREELEEVAAQAGLLVNLSGHLDLPFLFDRFPRRAYIDLDPAYTQFWHESEGCAARLGGHHYFFTVGLNVGRATCDVPANGIAWRPLPPPVVLDHWPVSNGDFTRFTTVASWRGSFGSLQHGGRRFGAKAHEFRKFLALPKHVGRPLEIALSIHADDHRDLHALRQIGWRIVDPGMVAATPDSFRTYVQGSAAEFSVAQGIYVETACGWFSDRTTRYLASGKPTLVQDTGFSDHYRVSRGLVGFRTLREAVRGAERIACDYEQHCRAARLLAEAHFNADVILGRFVEQVGVAP
jgi:hypothetical protein